YIVNRKQDMILSGAIDIYPSEIERVINMHPMVKDVAVIGVHDEKWGEVTLADIVLRNGETITKEEILTFCEGKLAKYKVPHHIDFVDDLPRNLQGKLLKYQIRKKYS